MPEVSPKAQGVCENCGQAKEKHFHVGPGAWKAPLIQGDVWLIICPTATFKEKR